MKEPFTKIELLYFSGCPSYKQVWSDLLDIITEHRLDASVRLVYIDSFEKANTLNFAGSPTVKVNGTDLENYDGEGVMACRVYDDNGRKGWPSKRLLERRLLESPYAERDNP